MRRGCSAFNSTAVLMLVFAFQVTWCFPQTPRQSGSGQDGRLREFLKTYVGVPTEETKTTRYSAAFVDLRGARTKEVIVFLSSNGWCGTGGCTMLILAPEGTSYRIVTKTVATRLPIRVLVTKSNGWRDISVVARINGIEPLYEALLSFDGDNYPSSSAVPPARRLIGKVPGKVVIPSDVRDDPLYP